MIRQQYQRPSSEGPARSTNAFNSVGSTLKEGRRVLESECPLAHVSEASLCKAPDPSFESDAGFSNVLGATIDAIAERCDEISAIRLRQGQSLCDVADSLCDYNTLLVALMPPHVAFVASGVNVALMAALVEGLDYPDVGLPRAFIEGMPIAGDGSAEEPGVQDSHVLRRVARTAVHSLGALAAGAAHGFLSNVAWLQCAMSRLRDQARKAGEGSAARVAMEAAHASCEKEASARPRPTMYPPMTFVEFCRWARESFGSVGAVRVMVRFALDQGLKADGTTKWRGIDDGKAAGLNAATRTLETLLAISFLWPALAARRFARAFRRLGKRCPPLWFGLDDLKAAYRTVPNSMPNLSVILVWCFATSQVMFYRLPAHSFGLVASVVNFNRLPEFICFVANVYMLVAVAHYVDDYVNCDVASAGQSSQDALQLIHVLLGFSLEMDKRQYNAPSNVVLGVLVNIALAHLPYRAARRGEPAQGVATAQPTAERIEKILSALRAAASRGKLTPAEAGKLFGKLGFTLLPVMWKVGRAACQALSQRQNWDRPPYSWTRPLADMLAYFTRVLPRLPVLEMPMFKRRQTPVLLYTDASFSWGKPGSGMHGRRRRARVMRLGIYAYDPLTKKEVWSKKLVPEEYYVHFAAGKKTYIAQGELLVALASYRNAILADLLRGRAVMHFIDNTVALSAIVHGYASKPDLGAMVNSLHEAMMDLRCYVWAEWVPSAANIADWPSRPDKEHLVPATAVYFEMALPDLPTFASMMAGGEE